jgi:hypothetical protein
MRCPRLRLDELNFAKELSCINGRRAGTYRELVLEDTLVQDRHSYNDGLAGLLAGGVSDFESQGCLVFS